MDFTKGVIVLLAALTVAPFSFAAGIGDLFDRHGFAIYPKDGGGSARAVVPVNATARNGARAVVPVGTAVQVTANTLAKNAVRVARAGSAIGVGWMAWDTYKAIKDSGVTVCPAPDFFCKQDAPTGPTPTVSTSETSWFFPNTGYPACDTASDNCNIASAAQQACRWAWARDTAFPNSYGSATFVNDRYNVVVSCNAGDGRLANATVSRLSNLGAPGPYVNTNPPKPMSDIDFETALEKGVNGGTIQGQPNYPPYEGMPETGWNSSMYKRMWDAVQADKKKYPAAIAAVAPSILTMNGTLGDGSKVAFSGAPVTLPQTTTSTRIINNPDGTTSTETIKETTTFTPSGSGSTVADGVPGAKESTVVTTSTTNNTTNNTVTNTTTSTPAGDATKEETDLCKLNPDVVACKKLGGPLEADPVKNKDVPLAITPTTGWGQSNGSCPAPNTFTAQGKTLEFKWDIYCQYATGIRPFFLGMGYILAVGGFMGLARKD